jgi:hypothetical protein
VEAPGLLVDDLLKLQSARVYTLSTFYRWICEHIAGKQSMSHRRGSMSMPIHVDACKFLKTYKKEKHESLQLPHERHAGADDGQQRLCGVVTRPLHAPAGRSSNALVHVTHALPPASPPAVPHSFARSSRAPDADARRRNC